MAGILKPEERRSLYGCRLAPKKLFHGRIRGERLTAKKGISIEFADYRKYSEGDDLRHLDWNILARLNSAVIRTYRDEEDLAVYLIVDKSPSMSFGEPPKLRKAIELAAAFGFVATNSGDAAYPIVLPMKEQPRPFRGSSGFGRLEAWLGTHKEPIRGKALAASLRSFASLDLRHGLVVLFSDTLDPDLSESVRLVSGGGHQVDLIQILSPEEIDPDIEGDLRLLDAEDGLHVEITANRSAVDQYRRNLQVHTDSLMETVHRSGGRFLRVQTEVSIANLANGDFRRKGWLIK